MSAAEALEVERPQPRDREVSPTVADDFAWRVLILLNLFRLAVGAVLLAAFYLVDEPRIIGSTDPLLAWGSLIGILGVGCAELVLLQRRAPNPTIQTYFQFGADLATVTLLVHASGGISSGLGGILVVTTGSLALLLTSERALLLAALSTLALLLEQTLAQLGGMTTAAQFAPTGILGAVIFVITAVVQALRTRIVETEALAEQRGLDLRNLVELNEYIIQHLRESIVVVDGDDKVRLINESALKLLGSDADAVGKEIGDVSTNLATQLGLWRHDSAEYDKARSAFQSSDGATTIQPHFALLGPDRSGGIMVFLEDTSLISERVLQAKLAALGRLSASIAHEIRNPIGAMSHAGQLLAESSTISSDDQRLTDIIRVNARRVSQIVDSVLTLTRRGKTRQQRLPLGQWLEEFAQEFTQTLELFEGSITVHGSDGEVEAWVDPTHLHQVVWNLCENAVKYASVAAGAIAVELHYGVLETSGRVYLDVADRGPGIPPEQAEQIFEPFYTGQPGGTGLGLYISRELCERNGAHLRYQSRAGGGSVFRVIFADPDRWQGNDESP
ncbi:MAG TPA: ATP-binding protein [Gammaproteobacteria bacterium]|jgi:two-component system sensor histidine kinase PilS (NtrC family)|nr:ATP-binding protein [Gammaproteobacteria bacterium]